MLIYLSRYLISLTFCLPCFPLSFFLSSVISLSPALSLSLSLYLSLSLFTFFSLLLLNISLFKIFILNSFIFTDFSVSFPSDLPLSHHHSPFSAFVHLPPFICDPLSDLSLPFFCSLAPLPL